MQLKRLAGIGLMAVGGLVAAFFAGLGVVVVANYLEPANMADALSTLAVVTLPGIVAGIAVLAMGRGLYGGWGSEAPLLRTARILLPVAGLVAAATFSVLLIALFVTGFGPEDWLSALKHGMGISAGAGAFVIGRKLEADPSPALGS